MHASMKDFPIPDNCHVYRHYGKSLPFIFPGFGYLPSFLLSALNICRKYDIDIIHGSSPTPVNAVAGYLTSKITKRPFVLEMRDPWIRGVDIDYNKLYSKSFIDPTKGFGKFLYKLEEKMCQHANAIVVTNPSIKEETLKVHPSIPEEKFKVIYNAADLDDFRDVPPKKLERFTIFYSGVLYKTRAIDKLIEAMTLVEDVQLLMCGGGPKDEIREFLNSIETRGLAEKVHYLGVLPNKELYQYYLGADVLFAGLDILEMNKYLLPSKIFNYMAAGKPIVGTGVEGGDLDKIIKKYQCGIMVNTTDPKKIAEAIESLRDKTLSRKLGENGRRVVETEFNREIQTRKLVEVYESVMS